MIEIKKKVNQEAIEIAEDFLKRVKSGDVQDVAIVGTLADAQTFNMFSCDYRPVSVLGQLRLLERDIIDLCTDTRRKPCWEFCE